MSQIHIFIDESGTYSQSNNESNYYLVSAIIIDNDDLNLIKLSAIDISKQYFNGGEIHACNIKKQNTKLRMTILNLVAKLPIKVYALAVQKNKLNDNYHDKKTFIKNIHKQLYSQLYQKYNKFNPIITADNHGSSEFMSSFKKYMGKEIDKKSKTKDQFNFNLDLFNDRFSFKDSKSNPFLQMADFYSNTIFKKFNGDEFADSYLKKIHHQIQFIDQFPYTKFDLSEALSNIDDKYDCKIANFCYMKAQDFININDSSIEDSVKKQNIILNVLIYNISSNQNKFISKSKILSKGLININSDREWSDLIAGLRDKGIIISSDTKGYKIPTKASDLVIFAKHVDTNVTPYMSRLFKASKSIDELTNGEINILDGLPLEKYIDYSNGL